MMRPAVALEIFPSWGLMLYCEDYKDDFVRLVDKVETTSCYQNNSNGKAQDGEISNIDQMRSDVKTCECLINKASTNPILKDFKDKNLDKDGKAIVIQETDNKKALEANLLANQLSTITKGNVQMTKAYLGMVKGAVSHANKEFEKRSYETVQVGSLCSTEGCSAPELEKTEEVNSAYLKTSLSSEQCISGKEFVTFKSFPDENVFKELSSSTFRPDAWDYNKIRARYDEIMGLSPKSREQHKEEISLLKSKIIYLSANPLIKTIFSGVENSATEKNTNHISDENFKGQLIKVMDKNNLGKAKAELFKMLQDYAAVKKKCFGKPGNCLEQASKDGGTSKFVSQLGEFYSRKEIALTEKFINDHRTATVEEAKKKEIKPENYTRNLLLGHFAQNNPGILSPSSCLGKSNINSKECAEIFVRYCPVAYSGLQAMEENNMDDVLKDNIDEQIVATFDITDLDKNEEFQKLNEEICHTPRKVDKRDAKGVTFFDFKKDFCGVVPAPAECSSNDPEALRKIRSAYLAKFKEPSSSNAIAFNDISEQAPSNDIDPNDIYYNHTMISSYDEYFDFSHFRETNGFPSLNSKKEGAFLAGLEKFASAGGNQQSGHEDINNEVVSNYVNSFDNQAVQRNDQVETKVEDLNHTERSSLLDDWKQELAKAKKDQGEKGQTEQSRAYEAAMNEKIATLEALLAQQKQLTETQYKLLNDALKAQTKAANTSEGVSNEVERSSSSTQKRSNFVASSDHAINENLNRGPASVREAQFDTSGSGSGSVGNASLGKGRSGTNAMADLSSSSDSSIERENAKLIRLRQNANGSITIESKGAGALAPNAIAVPISDDLYRMVQMNPTGLNLGQIEKSIPKEQIAELEKKEYIILLLQNGSRPPLEVRVRKENNRLVQLKDTQVVTRSVSLQGLQNTLKQ